jgi:hypothetical protein
MTLTLADSQIHYFVTSYCRGNPARRRDRRHANSSECRKNRQGLTRRGDGGPRAQRMPGRAAFLQTDSRDRRRAGLSRQFCDLTKS